VQMSIRVPLFVKVDSPLSNTAFPKVAMFNSLLLRFLVSCHLSLARILVQQYP
jgi:hypothetical protein